VKTRKRTERDALSGKAVGGAKASPAAPPPKAGGGVEVKMTPPAAAASDKKAQVPAAPPAPPRPPAPAAATPPTAPPATPRAAAVEERPGPVHRAAPGEAPAAAHRAPAAGEAPGLTHRTAAVAEGPAPAVRPPAAAAAAEPSGIQGMLEARFQALLGELQGLKKMVQPLVAPPPRGSDATLENSVDSLRRLLSELIELRMEAVVRGLVDVRREVDGDGTRERALARLDELLHGLGAVRFAAEAMDVVDPLIHVVVSERRVDGCPDGVIVETVRPGYRSARGLVLCKAAVAVNRR